MELDPAQAHAVACDDHPLAIIAGAGSGKTTVLAERIRRRIHEGSAEEKHLVAVTFSRQAAFELTRRLAGRDVRGITAGTFHAVAFGMLRQRWADLGRPAPTIVTARQGLVEDALRTARLDGRRRPASVEITGELDWSRARRIAPEDYPGAARRAGRRTRASSEALAEVFLAYRTIKRRRQVVDFDDLLEVLLGEIEADPSFAAQLRWRYRHLFVDEFQDVNPLQHAVLEAWRGGRADLCVVGDPRQAIYGWNGAEPGLLAQVEQTYPGIRIIRLQRNYRCSPQVTELAAAVLAGSSTPDDADAVRPPSGSVALVECADEEAEATLVVDRLRLLHTPGRSWASMAVLARTNGQLTPILAALSRAGVPAVLSGRAPSTDDEPRRGALLAEARRQPDPEALSVWAKDLDDAAAGGDGSLPARIGRAVGRFLDAFPGGTGDAFADWYELTDPGDERRRRHDAVELATFHAAKGREWHTVVVVGVEPGLVPHSTASSPAAIAEEERLLYVALTRASDELVVTWAATRAGRSRGRSQLLGRAPVTASAATIGDPPPVTMFPRRQSTPAGDPILAELRAWRTRAARAAAVPEVVVCSDDTLTAIAAELPTDIDQLAAIPGVGPMAAARLGPRVLAVLSSCSPRSR